jgi:predicted MFS family arabinose efflux permease
MLGSVLGVALGGVIANRWGWQAGFAAVGVLGLILAVIFAAVAREDHSSAPAGPHSRGSAGATRSLRAIASELFRPRSVTFICLGAGLQLLAASTLWAWLPTYLHRSYGLEADRAGLGAAAVVLFGGLGAVVWGIVADRLSVRNRRARLFVPAAVALATAALLSPALGFLPPGASQFAFLLAGGLVMAGTIGPCAAAMMEITHPGLRATAAAVLSLSQNLVGLAGGPLLTGVLSDRYGLQTAMAIAPLSCLLAAVMFVLAARHYEADVSRIAEASATTNPALQPQSA